MQFFHNNKFLKNKIQSVINEFLSTKYYKMVEINSENKKSVRIVLPFFGHLSIKMMIDISNLVSENFPHLNPHLNLLNN